MKHKFMDGPDIVPVVPESFSYKGLIDYYSKTCFEAINVADGAYLYENMIKKGAFF